MLDSDRSDLAEARGRNQPRKESMNSQDNSQAFSDAEPDVSLPLEQQLQDLDSPRHDKVSNVMDEPLLARFIRPEESGFQKEAFRFLGINVRSVADDVSH